MKWFKSLLIILITAYVSLWGISCFINDVGNAEEIWRAEFNDICSKTDISMSLTKEELTSLIERSDKLKAIIETLDETPQKVYMKRLHMCRNIFIYVSEVIESKEKNNP